MPPPPTIEFQPPGESAGRPRHGGDLAFATALHGEPPGGWLDLSTGINPVGYPAVSGPETLSRLPERRALADLLQAARKAYRLPARTRLVALPGTELAIRLLPLVAPAGPVSVLQPTYMSHIDAWQNAGRQVGSMKSLDELPADTTIVVLANPNNPDGRMVEPSALSEFAVRLGSRNGLLVVDEAFADVAPESSLSPQLADLPAVVLRSFGKFFGLPGLRLGFVAGDAATVARLESLLGDWAVSGPAIAIGQAALLDLPWQQATRQRLRRDGLRLREILSRNALAIAGGADLFVLAAHADAAGIHAALARHGVWTRTFSYEPTWLRIGLPADDAGFARLDAALATSMSGR